MKTPNTPRNIIFDTNQDSKIYINGNSITSGVIGTGNINGGFVNLFSTPNISDHRLSELDTDIKTISKQVSSIRKEVSANTVLAEQVQQITNSLEQLQSKSNDLKAPILLPPTEDMEIRLVSSNSLERLEEYRSDENKYYLLIGLFGGAVLGILSNWFTNEQFTITRYSIAFMILLIILTAFCIFMVYHISKRAGDLKTKISRTAMSKLQD